MFYLLSGCEFCIAHRGQWDGSIWSSALSLINLYDRIGRLSCFLHDNLGFNVFLFNDSVFIKQKKVQCVTLVDTMDSQLSCRKFLSVEACQECWIGT